MNGRPWIILGDMGELGDKSEQYHCQIAKYAKEKGIEKIFITGRYQSSIANVFGKNAFSFETIPELITFVLPIIKEDVNILIKASRFMRFETIVDALTKIKY
jgi:UDP-N-acetylmuramoyl-tripeptide--D-alanyl-D-alanine ligase